MHLASQLKGVIEQILFLFRKNNLLDRPEDRKQWRNWWGWWGGGGGGGLIARDVRLRPEFFHFHVVFSKNVAK